MSALQAQSPPVESAPVPFVTLEREHSEMAGELRAAFDRVLHRGAFILGEEVEAFEAEWAAYCGTAHCVGTASGTAALTLLVQAAGIGRGDEVVVPAHTYIATALGVLHAGAVPVLCDVERETGLMDVAAAAAAIGPRTAAILPVHLYGQVCDMPALQRLAARHGLALLEDAAQAHGARCAGQAAGTFGRGAAFSFYPSKNLGALGDAGAICTDDAEVAGRARMLRDLGQRRKSDHVVVGANERLDGVQAALLRVKLPRLAGANAARRRHAARYRERLDGDVALLHERPATPGVYHLFPIRVPARDDMAAALRAQAVATGVHYPLPLHRQPALQGHVVVPAGLPCAERWAAEELSLPMGPQLTTAEVDRVAQQVSEVVADG